MNSVQCSGGDVSAVLRGDRRGHDDSGGSFLVPEAPIMGLPRETGDAGVVGFLAGGGGDLRRWALCVALGLLSAPFAPAQALNAVFRGVPTGGQGGVRARGGAERELGAAGDGEGGGFAAGVPGWAGEGLAELEAGVIGSHGAGGRGRKLIRAGGLEASFPGEGTTPLRWGSRAREGTKHEGEQGDGRKKIGG